MILYIKCLCRSKEKLLAAKYEKLGYEIRNVSKSHIWRKQAREYNMPMPFIIVDGKPEPI